MRLVPDSGGAGRFRGGLALRQSYRLLAELVTHHQAGGGGHGHPFARAPEAVARDVWNGKVTVEAARARYGVAVDAGGVVDAAETAQLRQSDK